MACPTRLGSVSATQQQKTSNYGAKYDEIARFVHISDHTKKPATEATVYYHFVLYRRPYGEIKSPTWEGGARDWSLPATPTEETQVCGSKPNTFTTESVRIPTRYMIANHIETFLNSHGIGEQGRRGEGRNCIGGSNTQAYTPKRSKGLLLLRLLTDLVRPVNHKTDPPLLHKLLFTSRDPYSSFRGPSLNSSKNKTTPKKRCHPHYTPKNQNGQNRNTKRRLMSFKPCSVLMWVCVMCAFTRRGKTENKGRSSRQTNTAKTHSLVAKV